MARSRIDISVLTGGLRLRCDTSKREYVSRGDGEGGNAARRGPAGFPEWRDRADVHHWQQGYRCLCWILAARVRDPGKQEPTIELNA